MRFNDIHGFDHEKPIFSNYTYNFTYMFMKKSCTKCPPVLPVLWCVYCMYFLFHKRMTLTIFNLL